jgi:hypothetical protein
VKVQRVYTDTSVIGGCFDPEFAPWSNGLLRDFETGRFVPVVSVVVATEVAPAPEPVRRKYADLLDLGAEMLDVSDEVRALSELYAHRRIVPSRFSNDRLHIALATVAGVDVLVSWNFQHIVHFDKIRLFNAANLEAGYRPIAIYSPREVTSYGAEE